MNKTDIWVFIQNANLKCKIFRQHDVIMDQKADVFSISKFQTTIVITDKAYIFLFHTYISRGSLKLRIIS